MDKKSKNFFIVFILILFLSIIFTYYQYVIQKNFAFFTDEETFYEELKYYE